MPTAGYEICAKLRTMQINLASVFVTDQQQALDFYTNILGFEVKHNIDMGEHAWMTVTAPGDPDGTELLLEPAAHPAVGPYRDALRADGIPMAQFAVDDVAAEHERLAALGVEFTVEPMDVGTAIMAVFDDTCGNYITIVAQKS